MYQRELISLTLKGLLAWLTLSGLIWYFGECLGKALFPLLTAGIMTLSSEISPSLNLVKSISRFDDGIELSAWVLRPIYLNADQFILPGTDLKSAVHLLHALVPVVIEGVILLVWPVQRWSQRCLLVVLGVLTAILVVLAIVPAQLLGKLEISFQFSPTTICVVILYTSRRP